MLLVVRRSERPHAAEGGAMAMAKALASWQKSVMHGGASAEPTRNASAHRVARGPCGGARLACLPFTALGRCRGSHVAKLNAVAIARLTPCTIRFGLFRTRQTARSLAN